MKLKLFWMFFGVDVVIAAILLFFFIWGIADGTVSAFNIKSWMFALLGVALIVGGGFWLKSIDQLVLANIVLMILALPGLGYALIMVVAIVTQTSWN
ncbi:MAG: osmoprotectant transporter permease [Calditrichia bacterium]